MLPDHMSEFYDIYGLRYMPWWQWPVIHFIKIFLVILGAVFVGWLLWRVWYAYRQKRLLLPWNKALYDLRNPRFDGYIQRGDSALFYSALLVIIKNYLERRYEIVLCHLTDDELVNALQKFGLDQSICVFIHELVSRSVTARFAQQLIAREIMQEDKKCVIDLIVSISAAHKKQQSVG